MFASGENESERWEGVGVDQNAQYIHLILSFSLKMTFLSERKFNRSKKYYVLWNKKSERKMNEKEKFIS